MCYIYLYDQLDLAMTYYVLNRQFLYKYQAAIHLLKPLIGALTKQKT